MDQYRLVFVSKPKFFSLFVYKYCRLIITHYLEVNADKRVLLLSAVQNRGPEPSPGLGAGLPHMLHGENRDIIFIYIYIF